ncbi:hypothetical protein EMIT040CA3_40058 [Bacillus pseudomycoides]
MRACIAVSNNILYNLLKKTFSYKGGEFRVNDRGRGEISGVIKNNGFSGD